MIEEIRRRIEARKKNTYRAKDDDEYADGIFTGLTYALGIIDKVEKEHPAPSDVEEAARGYATAHIKRAEWVPMDVAFLDGAKWKEGQLMKDAVEVEVYWNRGNEPRVIVHLPKGSAMPGDKVKFIILK